MTDGRFAGVATIAVLRGGGLGDLVFALPAVEALGRAYPDARIVLLGTAAHRQLLEGRRGAVDRVEVLPETPGVQGHGDDAAGREQFFARSGFVVTGDATGGRFGIGALRDLRTTWNTDKVLEITPALVAEAFGGQAQAGALKRQVEALEAQIDGLARDRRAAEVMSRIWLAVTVLAVVFGIVFGIQPRVA